MKSRTPSLPLLPFLTSLLLLTACATTSSKWNSRVGTCSFSDAVQELGPPSHTFVQPDGSLVAEWLRLGGEKMVNPFPFIGSRYNRRPSPSAYHNHRTPDSILRLTFNTDQLLTEAEQRSR